MSEKKGEKGGVGLGFDEYQRRAEKYDAFTLRRNELGMADLKEVGFTEKILGLTGEAGEVADKFKKIMRDRAGEITEEDRVALEKELGDVLWYVAALARYLGLTLGGVAEGNLGKLESRYQRGRLGGEGDER